jgi:hypothetical protein
MTIGTAWIRNGAFGEELWFASDSRLTGDGNIWDACPKLMALPRRDVVVGFSGTTAQAYPLLLQIANAVAWYRAAFDGTLEFFHMVGHLERVATSMMKQIISDPMITGARFDRPEFSTTGDTLIIGGYSRAEGRLALRSLHYQPAEEKWKFDRPRRYSSLGHNQMIASFGDAKSKSRFVYLLKLLLDKRGIPRSQTLGFEPLEVLATMLQMPTSTAQRLPMNRRPITIGGPPQVFRVLPGAQATAVAVQWEENKKSAVYLQGRETFHYEYLDVPLVIFDNSRPHFHAPGKWPADAVHIQESADEIIDTDSEAEDQDTQLEQMSRFTRKNLSACLRGIRMSSSTS